MTAAIDMEESKGEVLRVVERRAAGRREAPPAFSPCRDIPGNEPQSDASWGRFYAMAARENPGEYDDADSERSAFDRVQSCHV